MIYLIEVILRFGFPLNQSERKIQEFEEDDWKRKGIRKTFCLIK